MFARISAWLLALLISIFPFLDRYSPALDWKAATNTVMAAVKARDIDAIEAFMCKNIKDNVPDLRGEISNLLDAIEGTITSHSTEFFDDFSVASGGRTIMQGMSITPINTSVAKYQINIIWEYYNNFSLAERGIRAIRLSLPGVPGEWHEMLVVIEATAIRVHN